MVVKCSPIEYFKPLELTTSGNITSVNITSHVAGVLPIKVILIVLCNMYRCMIQTFSLKEEILAGFIKSGETLCSHNFRTLFLNFSYFLHLQ